MLDWRDFSAMAVGATFAWSFDYFQNHRWLYAMWFLALFFWYLGEFFNQLADNAEEDENIESEDHTDDE